MSCVALSSRKTGCRRSLGIAWITIRLRLLLVSSLPLPINGLNCVFQRLKKLRPVALGKCGVEPAALPSFAQVLLHIPHRKRHTDVRLAEGLARRPYALGSRFQTPGGK